MRESQSSVDHGGKRPGTLAQVLRAVRAHRQASRAELTVLAGLSKATVARLVTELERRGLVQSAGSATGRQGRPGQLVELRPAAACGIGLDVHPNHVGATVVDLSGKVLLRREWAGDVAGLGAEWAMDELAVTARRALAAVAELGGWVSGVTVAVPGLVDQQSGTVRLAPRLRWRDVAVLDGLAARAGLPLELLGLGNDGHLGAIAEYEADSVADLIYLAGDRGLSVGMICGGTLLRGALGFAGEVSHLPLDLPGRSCLCGRRGCWEAQVGIDALLSTCAPPDDPVHNPALGLAERMALVRQRAEQGDWRTRDALHQLVAALALGASVLVNLLNPAVLVLGGYFAALADWLVEPVQQEVRASALDPRGGGTVVVASRLGFSAAATGGAISALRRVLDDPAVVPVRQSEEAHA